MIALRLTLPLVDFKYRNRKLLCVVRAHHLLQHFNDLAKQWFRSLYRIYAPTWLSQNRCDKMPSVYEQATLLVQAQKFVSTTRQAVLPC
jgi:hypothetical protein